MRIPNRVVTLTDEGLMYDSDPRDAELMARNPSLDASKGIATPGVKPPDISNKDVKEGVLEAWDGTPQRDSEPEGDHEEDRRTI